LGVLRCRLASEEDGAERELPIRLARICERPFLAELIETIFALAAEKRLLRLPRRLHCDLPAHHEQIGTTSVCLSCGFVESRGHEVTLLEFDVLRQA
jgi:hypothetical protein